MTVVIIAGMLTFAAGLPILRPFAGKAGRLQVRGHDPDDDRRRALLRQLRDLDDDLAAGKLTAGDHIRLREPVEREAAAALHRKAHGPAGATAVVTSGPQPAPATTGPQPGPATTGPATTGPRSGPATTVPRSGPATTGPRQDRDAGAGARRWSRRTATLLTLAAAAAGVAILLVGAVSARRPGQTITGNSITGAAPVAASPGASAPAAQSTRKQPTRQQLAAVAAAQAQVKQHPRNVSAHLTLAEAYAAAGAGQLAAVEYLAVTRLDPANAEANTNLALLAFEVGRAAQGKAMVDRVLAADPKYPEALYVRGLINLMGLRRPRAAERDFSAYLAVAPFGSQRTAAATLLALAQSQDHR
jgi:cytochrome c-type biogenesis protein CcmH/NrfG